MAKKTRGQEDKRTIEDKGARVQKGKRTRGQDNKRVK